MNSEFLVTELHGRHEMYNKVVEIVVLLRGMSAQGAGPGVLFDFVYYFIFDFIIIIIILFYTKPWLLNYPSSLSLQSGYVTVSDYIDIQCLHHFNYVNCVHG